MLRLTAVFISLLSFDSQAAHLPGQPFTAADVALNANNILVANPPLPMLRYKQGEYKITVQPGYFWGDIDATGRDSMQQQSGANTLTHRSGSFRGWSLGTNASYSFADRWGVYFYINGVSLSGDFKDSGPEAGNPSRGVKEIRDASASYIVMSPGIVYQFFSERKYTMPVFVGPMFTRVQMSQRIVDTPQAGTGNDYDLEGSELLKGVLIGAHTAIDYKFLRFNPFVIYGHSMDDSIGLQVKNTRLNGGAANGYLSMNDYVALSRTLNNPSFLGVGMNLVYLPWNLSVNVTSPILGAQGDVLRTMKGYGQTTLSASWSFGNFDKK